MKPPYHCESDSAASPSPMMIGDAKNTEREKKVIQSLAQAETRSGQRDLSYPETISVLGGLFWFFLPIGLIVAAWYLAPYAVERYHYAATRGRVQAEYENAAKLLKETPLDQVSQAFQLVAQKIRPSVVSIKLAIRTANGLDQGNQGSGVVMSADGYILTNQHVVGLADRVLVTLHDRSQHWGQVVGRDQQTDLAVIKVDAPNLIPADWGDSDHLQVGSMVWAVGSPYGLEQTVTSGIISGTERIGREGPFQEFLQTDAAVNPGNSGGPLVNSQGQVVGINTSIYGDSFQGISFAVPSTLCRFVFEELLDDGEVSRGFLGVVPRPVFQHHVSSLNLPDLNGAMINEIDEGTPASRSPLRINDVIRRWNGHPIRQYDSLFRYISMSPPNTYAKVEIIRNGIEKTIEVPVGDRGDYNLR